MLEPSAMARRLNVSIRTSSLPDSNSLINAWRSPRGVGKLLLSPFSAHDEGAADCAPRYVAPPEMVPPSHVAGKAIRIGHSPYVITYILCAVPRYRQPEGAGSADRNLIYVITYMAYAHARFQNERATECANPIMLDPANDDFRSPYP